MEARNRQGYCKDVTRTDRSVDGSVQLYDKRGSHIGSVSEAEYTKILLREADRDYANRTTPPWAH